MFDQRTRWCRRLRHAPFKACSRRIPYGMQAVIVMCAVCFGPPAYAQDVKYRIAAEASVVSMIATTENGSRPLERSKWQFMLDFMNPKRHDTLGAAGACDRPSWGVFEGAYFECGHADLRRVEIAFREPQSIGRRATGVVKATLIASYRLDASALQFVGDGETQGGAFNCGRALYDAIGAGQPAKEGGRPKNVPRGAVEHYI